MHIYMRDQPSSEIECQLNNYFESKLPPPVLNEVGLKSTTRTVFDNNTANIARHANVAMLSLYMQLRRSHGCTYELERDITAF